MEEVSKNILTQFEVRKSARQKKVFREYLMGVLRENGYCVTIEEKSGLFHSHNVVVGNPEDAKILFTAHYDTCPRLPFPNFIMPRNIVASLLYSTLMALPMLALCIGAATATAVVFQASLLVMELAYFAPFLFFLWWLLDGAANPHTANDNTSGVLTLTEILLALPEEARKNVCCVFFDNEERGLLGSAAFYRTHKEFLQRTPVMNFDCVSDGDVIQLYPQKSARGDNALLAYLRECFSSADGKTVEVFAGRVFYPSDQKHFPLGIGVCALQRSRYIGLWLGRIHTRRDTMLDEKNIELLCHGAVHLAAVYSEENHGK